MEWQFALISNFKDIKMNFNSNMMDGIKDVATFYPRPKITLLIGQFYLVSSQGNNQIKQT